MEALAALKDHTERLTNLSAGAGVYNLADLECVANLSTLAAQAEGAKAKLVLELSVLNALKEAGVK